MDETITDGGLLDVSELDTYDLLTVVDDLGLANALDQILDSSRDNQTCAFQSSI